MNKAYLIFLTIFIAIIAICYYIWFSPLFMLIGAILAISCLICFIHHLFTKSDDLAENGGCLISFIIVAILVVAFFMSDKYVISKFGDQRHLYSDCRKIEGYNLYNVSKFSAICWGCLEDCNQCASRHKAEIEKKKAEYKKKKKNADLKFIEQQIDELQNVKQAILNGEDIDVNDYEFRIDCEDDIASEAIEEYREGEYEPRGRR